MSSSWSRSCLSLNISIHSLVKRLKTLDQRADAIIQDFGPKLTQLSKKHQHFSRTQMTTHLNLTNSYYFWELIKFSHDPKQLHILKKDELNTGDLSLVSFAYYPFHGWKKNFRSKKGVTKYKLYSDACLIKDMYSAQVIMHHRRDG